MHVTCRIVSLNRKYVCKNIDDKKQMNIYFNKGWEIEDAFVDSVCRVYIFISSQ